MKTYLLHFENKNDMTIIIKLHIAIRLAARSSVQV